MTKLRGSPPVASAPSDRHSKANRVGFETHPQAGGIARIQAGAKSRNLRTHETTMEKNTIELADGLGKAEPATEPTLRLRSAPGGLGTMAAAIAVLYPVALAAAALLVWLTITGPATAIG